MTSPFATNLKAALADQRMTQEALAREIGVSLRIVQGWCSGEVSQPRWKRVVAVAEVLHRDPSWFFVDREPEPDPPVRLAA